MKRLKRWAIYVDGQMVEGGFSTRAAAEAYAYKEYGPSARVRRQR